MLESILPSKQREREQVAKDVEEFLANGGVIEILKPHKEKRQRDVLNTDEGEYDEKDDSETD